MLELIRLSQVVTLQDEGGGAGGLGQVLASPIFMIVLMFVIFYFLLIRPQQKQQKKARDMLEALKKGDRVISQAGIYGRIVSIDGNVVTLEVDKQVNIRVLKSSIAGLEMAATDASQKEAEDKKQETKK